MRNVRLFLAVLLFTGVTFSQTDSFYVVPSAPTSTESLSLVVVIHNVPCFTLLTYGHIDLPPTPFGTPGFSFYLFYYTSQEPIPIPCSPCDCTRTAAFVFRSGPVSPGSYTVSEVVQPLACSNPDSSCVVSPIEIESFTVTGTANVTNRPPAVKSTLRKSMSGAVYNVRGELISRTANQCIHGICIMKTGDQIEKTYR
jgi:hypothetical protein